MNTIDHDTFDTLTRPVLASALEQVRTALDTLDDTAKPSQRISAALAAVRVVAALEVRLGLIPLNVSSPDQEEPAGPA